jgi:SAM-dependent methyltransferase
MAGPTSPERFHAEIARYYSERLRNFGTTPAGVDWRDEQGQQRRFAQLLKLFRDRRSGSLCELGCGYGALYGYLRSAGWDVDYLGCDISEAMITAARNAYAEAPRAAFHVGARPPHKSEFCLASGIFNVRLAFGEREWLSYVFATIEAMADASTEGFAFNCLSMFCDSDRKEGRLFYADPGDMLNHCIAKYGRHAALLHDYSPHEFTILMWHGDRGSR